MTAAQLKAHIALFSVALIYGANYVIARDVMANDYLHPFAFILLRVVVAVVLFYLFHRFFVREPVARRDIPLLALCGLTGVALNQLFFFSGLKLTTPINAALIMTNTPVLVMIASAVLIGERITWRKLAGIVLGAGGAILLITSGEQVDFSAAGRLGDLLVLSNATAYGIYLVLVQRLMKKYHPLTVVKWVFLFGAVIVVPLGTPSLLKADWAAFPPGIWLAIAYVLVFTTFLAYLFNAFALKTVTPSVVSIYIYLQPLLAMLIAVSWGKDHLTGIKVLAGTLIFGGVFLVSKRPGKHSRKISGNMSAS